MFDAARRNNVYVVEAYPYRAQPQTIKLQELLRAKAIGRLHLVLASFCFLMTDTSNIRFNPTLAGGSLMDAGSYPISLTRMIAGERALRVHATARMAETGVDRTVVGSLEFPGGLLAQISCSFATVRYRQAHIVGEAGLIEKPMSPSRGRISSIFGWSHSALATRPARSGDLRAVSASCKVRAFGQALTCRSP